MQIRKNSNILRSNGGRISFSYSTIHNSEIERTNMEYSLPKNFSRLDCTTKTNEKSSQPSTESSKLNHGFDITKLEAENNSLRTLLKSRENEIYKLKREIHKLKVSILFRSSNNIFFVQVNVKLKLVFLINTFYITSISCLFVSLRYILQTTWIVWRFISIE